MSDEIKILLGSLRYKSAPNVDYSYKLPLVQNTKQNVEFDRTIDVDLEQLFDDERQASTIFRPAGKFILIFKNSYQGVTSYPPFENNLYLLNTDLAAAQQCLGVGNIDWSGLPQYNEFDFIRTDYNVSGYTQPPNNHLLFQPYSANTYNWNFFMSYAYQNDFTKQLQAIDIQSLQTLSWTVADGIPFVVNKIQQQGQNLISFRCPVKHGLNVGEFVKLSLTYNGTDTFEVYSLGLETYNSDEYIFNLVDVGYTGTTFLNNTTGTFKRMILDSNSADTISKYYIRKHKILTNVEDAVLVKAGFEENVFGTKKKFESSAYTPNNVTRISTKEGGQSYTVSFNKDINLNGILDNLGRPVSELFFTVMWKGYFGWTQGPRQYIKQGYEFNLPKNPVIPIPNPWWDISNPLSDTNFTLSSWTNLGYTFYYVDSLNSGDVLDGYYCEWNDFEQKERVISENYHKFTFNQSNFAILGINPPTNQFGYYYQPHYPLKIREFSDYIEFANGSEAVIVPNYSYFSTTLNQFIWRDIYTYGFVDGTTGLGVNYPFLNEAHYPFGNNVFRIIPEGTNYLEQTIIAEPTTDNCE